METAGETLNSSDGRQVRASATDKIALTLKIRRFNPEVSDESWWDEFTVEMEPTDRLLDAITSFETALT